MCRVELCPAMARPLGCAAPSPGTRSAAPFAPGRWCLRSLGREDPRENRRVLFSAMLVGEGGFPSGLTCAHRSSSAPSVEAGLGQPGPLSAESGPVSHSAAVGPRSEESAQLGPRTAVRKTPLVAPTSSTVLLAAKRSWLRGSPRASPVPSPAWSRVGLWGLTTSLP